MSGRRSWPVTGRGPYATPLAMSETDLASARDGFAAAAVRAVRAGFDGVELHAANGYLLDQFITTYTNERTDRYGETPEARIRYVAEVTEAAAEATPEGFVVGVRLSQTKVNDFSYRWAGGAEEAAVYYRALAEAGAGYLHLASEGRDWVETATLEEAASGSESSASDVTIGSLAREITGLPVVINGGMHDPQQVAQVLEEGHGDLVSLGRGALANPDWPQRLAAGRDLKAFDPAMLEPTAALENAEAEGGNSGL